MAEQQTETFRKLIELAETKAAKTTDLTEFDFVEYLEKGGVLMPTDTVTIFTDSRASAKIMDLHRRHDELKQAATEKRTREFDAARDALFTEKMQAAKDAGTWPSDNDDDQPDFAGLIDEDQPTERQAMAALWTEVFAEIPVPDVQDVPETEALLAELELLEKKVWDSRIVLDLEGMQPGAQRDMEALIDEELSMKYQSALSAEKKLEYANTRRGDEMVAATIVRLQIPAKGVDRDFSGTRMPAYVARRFLRPLESSQIDKLLLAAQTLSFAAAIVEPSVDAGFPGGSADPATVG